MQELRQRFGWRELQRTAWQAVNAEPECTLAGWNCNAAIAGISGLAPGNAAAAPLHAVTSLLLS